MEITKQSKFIKCAECGITANKTTSWYICTECEKTLCGRCKKQSHCTDHTPWGKWLHASSSAKEMIFK